MPWPSGFVVKNGSKTWSMMSARNSATGVADRDHDVLACGHLGVASGIVIVEECISGLDGELALPDPSHRVR